MTRGIAVFDLKVSESPSQPFGLGLERAGDWPPDRSRRRPDEVIE